MLSVYFYPKDNKNNIGDQEGGVTMVEGHCMKCKAARQMKDAKQVKMKNGRDAVKGTCMKCGTKMFKIGKME